MPAPMDLLLAGVPFERLSVLSRRPSVRVTEKCYIPRVKPRQEQLQQDVRGSWRLDADASSESNGAPEDRGLFS